MSVTFLSKEVASGHIQGYRPFLCRLLGVVQSLSRGPVFTEVQKGSLASYLDNPMMQCFKLLSGCRSTVILNTAGSSQPGWHTAKAKTVQLTFNDSLSGICRMHLC